METSKLLLSEGFSRDRNVLSLNHYSPVVVMGTAGCTVLACVVKSTAVASYFGRQPIVLVLCGVQNAYDKLWIFNQLGALFSRYLFFHLYMFQATSAHHQEGTIVSTHPLV
jgi:hypothetical protein